MSLSKNSTLSLEGSSAQGLWGATLGFFFGFAAVSLFGPTAAKLKGIMELSPLMLAFLVATPNLSGSLLRIPFAAWVDTTGGRKPFLVLLLISLLGMLGLSWVMHAYYPMHLTNSMYPILLILSFFCGCGIATFSVGISQVSYWFPMKKQGMALGVYAGIGNLAPGMFAFLIPLALHAWGLPNAYIAWFIFLALGVVLYYFIGKNAWYFQLLDRNKSPKEARQIATSTYNQELFPAGSLTDSLKHSAKIWQTWVLVLLYFTTFGGFLALTAWLPTYWKSFFQTSIEIAGLLTALYSILASVIRVPGGFVSDYLGGENTAIFSMLLMTIGATIMMLSHNYALSIVGTVLMACGMGIGNAAVFKLVPQNVPQAVGGAAGWVGGLGAFGGFVIPPVMGLFVANGGAAGYATGFVAFLALGILSIFLALLLKYNHLKQIQKKS